MKTLPSTLLLFGLAALILPVALRGEPTPPPPPVPRIEFAHTSYNVGTIWEGEKAVHTFTFKNTGTGTLLINKVRTSCGCTAALVSRKELEPDQEGEIKAEFNTRRYLGNQKKQIYVSCNDPAQSTVRLALEAKVITAASFSPRSLNFRGITRGEEASLIIRLVKEVTPLKITGIETQPDIFRARRLEGKGEAETDREPVEIEVTVVPETPLGQHRGKLTVHIDHPRLQKLEANLVAVVEGLVEYSPRMLFFNHEDQKSRRVKKVRLTKKGKPDLEITATETTLGEFKVELTEIEPRRAYEISIQPKAEMIPGRFRGHVVIRTNQEGEKEIKIPLTAQANK